VDFPKKDLHNELLALRSSLVDANTRFPAYPACFEQLKKITQNQLLGVVLLQLSDTERVEAIFGFERYEVLLKKAALHVQETNNRDFDGALVLAQRGVYDDQFCVFVPYDLLAKSTLPSLERIAKRLYYSLEGVLSLDGLPGLSVHIGYSILHYNPFLRFERLVHRVVEEAASLAQHQEEAELVLHELELRQILTAEKVTTVFHPIVSLEDYVVIGYEALTRGPEGTPYQSPETLFSLARQSKLGRQLDHLCKVTAIASAKGKPPGTLLFLNTLPTTLDDPSFLNGTAPGILSENGISAEDVVWELTERHPIEDYGAFGTVMKSYLGLGYQVAIDDVGTGYSSIQTISHVRPRFLKVDISLVSGIHENLLKQELVSSLLMLGKNINASVIAEGVESLEELATLRELGVTLAQGYLFGQPGAEFPTRVCPGDGEVMK
jgi:EAL domain-containing protein (putative c-di-GMP-specific phosphodiesterase class I)